MRNSQPFSAPKPSAAPDLSEPPLPQQQARNSGPFNRLWKAWLWLTGPRSERFSKTTTAQETLRRSRLISALLVLIVLTIPLLVPSALVQPLIWRAIVALAVGAVVVAFLNRQGIVTGSGIAYIVLVDGVIAGYLITKPIFTYGNIPNLDLFILTILIAGMVLPRQLIPVTGALHILIIIAIFNLKHQDDLLLQGIHLYFNNQRYTAIVNAILLQVSGTGIAWLHAWSVSRAILRASRAEELAEARARINEQARQIAAQKQRLEAGISALQTVQARVANGEYSARVSLQDNELLPLAVSFNIMAERLSRVEGIEQEHRRLEHAVEQALSVCNALARGVAPAAMRATGTVVDRLFPFLARLSQVTGQLAHGSALADDLRTVLQRQHEHLANVESRLVNTLSLAKELAIETAHPLARLASETTNGLPGTRGFLSSGPLGERTSGPLGQKISEPLGTTGKSEQQTRIAARINSLLDQQISLLEQANKHCTQASDLGTRCTQGTRILSQWLKEAG